MFNFSYGSDGFSFETKDNDFAENVMAVSLSCVALAVAYAIYDNSEKVGAYLISKATSSL